MPVYEIHHICPLTDPQRDDLAAAITALHSTRFATPALFVNVKFTPAHDAITYIGGARRQGNMITAAVRVGPSRAQADWDALCEELVAAWGRIVPVPLAKGQGHRAREYELRGVFLMGGIVGGWEVGFVLPKAGEDGAWLRKHWGEITARAEGGDEEMGEVVREVRERGLIGDEA